MWPSTPLWSTGSVSEHFFLPWVCVGSKRGTRFSWYLMQNVLHSSWTAGAFAASLPWTMYHSPKTFDYKSILGRPILHYLQGNIVSIFFPPRYEDGTEFLPMEADVCDEETEAYVTNLSYYHLVPFETDILEWRLTDGNLFNGTKLCNASHITSLHLLYATSPVCLNQNLTFCQNYWNKLL